jgi:predicted flap endonuclease-1-like 5' DNA nuclease
MLTHSILLAILQQAEEEEAFPWWLVILILVIIMAIVIWALTRNAKATEVPHVEHAHAEPEPAAPTRAPEPVAAVVEAPPIPDDLKLIEGIGPKISSLLNAAGIFTFAQLANTPVADLQAVLDKAGLRLGDPATWPEQAALAAKGDLVGLQALQDSLKGGRKV